MDTTESASHAGPEVESATLEASGPPAGDAGPGMLRGPVTLTVHTRHAERLVRGRQATAETPAIIGLLLFAHKLRPLWHGALTDDPYADWWLLKVEAALSGAKEVIAESHAALTERLEASDALVIASATSTRPARVRLRFSNPYAFSGARVVSAYDALACAVLTARHVALMTRAEAEQMLQRGGRAVRHAFLTPLDYRLTGVTRSDIEQRNSKAQQAEARMGTVPDDVLSGRRRAAHAPAPSRALTQPPPPYTLAPGRASV